MKELNDIYIFLFFDNMDMFELSIWKGDWGLPSVDTECLQVLVCNLYRLYF